MQTEALERQVGTLQNQAAAIAIKDQGTYDRTVQLLAVVKSIQDGEEIKEMRVAVDKAHEAHGAALKVWHRFFDPLEKIEKLLKGKILDFDRKKKADEEAKQRALEAAEQKKRDEAARKIREEADQKAREEAAAAAAEAERRRKEVEAEARRRAAAAPSKAAAQRIQQEAKATVQEIAAETKAAIDDIKSSAAVVAEEQIATVQAAPMPEIAPMYSRSSAVSTRANWKAEFEGATAEAKFNSAVKFLRWVGEDIPSRAYLLELEDLVEVHPTLDKLAKDRKSLAVGKIPGVRIYDAGSVAARTGEMPF